MVASHQTITDASASSEMIPSPSRLSPPWHALLVLAAGAIDAAILTMAARGHIEAMAAGASHLAVVALIGLPLFLVRDVGADKTMLSLAALATTCLGPLGSIGALVAMLLAPARPAPTPLLDAWYERIAHSVETDPDSQLCDMVAIGRAVNLSGPPPTSFARVMTHGNLAERQALLGHVARHFDVAYLPALKIALTSPEPVIRVQAAAVATKVQLALSRIVAGWHKRTEQQMEAVEALGAMVEIEACLGSGLIEAGDRARAEAALNRAREQASALIASAGFRHTLLTSRENAHQLTAIRAYESLLMRERRYKELRNWRRLLAAGMHPAYRLHPRPMRRKRQPVSTLEPAR